MSKTITLTPEGYQALQDEHKQLKEVDRPAMVKHVEEARALGDLRENEAYHAARSKLALIQGRIEELEVILKDVVVSEIEAGSNYIGIGSTVHLEINDNEKVFKVVHEHEADIQSSKISVDSPIGKGLIGKKIGDVVEVEVPAGTQSYKITNIV